MLREREAEVLDLFRPRLASERVDRVLHRVGRKDRGVVSREVSRLEIPLEAHGDRQVLKVVRFAVARYAHETDA